MNRKVTIKLGWRKLHTCPKVIKMRPIYNWPQNTLYVRGSDRQRVYPAKINPITRPPGESPVREHPNSDLRFSCQQLIIVQPRTQTSVTVYERRSFTRASEAKLGQEP